MSAVRISSRDSVEQNSPGDIDRVGAGLLAGGEVAPAEGAWAMRMRLERVRCGYSQSIPRAEHRRHDGKAKSQRRLALVQAAHDLPLDGGIAVEMGSKNLAAGSGLCDESRGSLTWIMESIL